MKDESLEERNEDSFNRATDADLKILRLSLAVTWLERINAEVAGLSECDEVTTEAHVQCASGESVRCFDQGRHHDPIRQIRGSKPIAKFRPRERGHVGHFWARCTPSRALARSSSN